MGDSRRDLLAIQVIVVTYLAAQRAFTPDPDLAVRELMLQAARDKALGLLTTAETNLRYLPGSALDIALRDARRRIESGTAG